MSKPITTPTKADLFSALNSFNINRWGHDSYASKKLRNLIHKEEIAKKAIEKFQETNKEYKRLQKEAELTNEARQKLQDEEHKELNDKMRKVRNAIYSRGVHTATISMVTELIEELESR